MQNGHSSSLGDKYLLEIHDSHLLQGIFYTTINKDYRLIDKLLDFPADAITNTWYRNMFNTIKKMYLRKEEINLYTIPTKAKIPLSEILNYLDKSHETDDNTWHYCLDTLIENYKETYFKEMAFSNESYDERINALNQLRSKYLQTADELSHLGDIALEREELEASGYFNRFCKTGMGVLDSRLDIYKEDLIVIGARPGVGKTAMAIQIAAHLSKKNPSEAFIYFNLEISKFQCEKRFSKHNPKLDILLYNGSSITISRLRKIITDKSPKVIFIDQLNKIDPDIKQKTIRENYVIVTRELKKICKDYGIVVFLLAQLNRDAANNKPSLRDFKESGSIEEEADIVFLLHEETKTAYGYDGKITVPKYRNGGIFIKDLIFNGNEQRFEVR